ncbi:hypothetical protein [Streptomyces globisporus]|uniref:hypothetical protein n=1 Tax=Streptomyces globisporus TaxID=1908 RepID=UPI0037A9D69D
MDGELITAIAATAVSLVAASVAVWQARTAASSAGAAKEQAALMRRQLEAEDAERHEAAGPQFVIEEPYTDTRDSDSPYGVLALKQTTGPALETVLVTAKGAGVEGLKNGPRGDLGNYPRVPRVDIGAMATGNGTTTVHVALDYDHTTTTVILDLECRTPDGRTWQRSISSSLAPIPEPPRRRTSRSPYV